MIRLSTVRTCIGNPRLHNPSFAFVIFAMAMAISQAAHAAPDSAPCTTSPAYRALDFWLGDWNIAAPGAAPDATSTVTADLGQCVVVERWKGEGDHTGENLFGYSAGDQGWHGFFADSRGHVHVFPSGSVSSTVAQFTGPNRGDDGGTVLNRITIRRVDSDHVEQMWEKSTDDGKTWIRQFLLLYTRKRG